MDRRSFVRLLGLGSAITPLSDSKGNVIPTKVTAESYQAIAGRPPIHYEVDIAPEWLWSGVSIPPYEMRDQIQLFRDDRWSASQKGDFTLTNLDQAGQLCAPTVYAIEKIGVLFSPRSVRAVREQFISRYELKLWIAGKRYFEAPLSGIFDEGDIAFSGVKGEPLGVDDNLSRMRGFVDLEIPIVIPSQCSFYVELSGTAFRTSEKLKLWAVFRGRNGRGVQ